MNHWLTHKDSSLPPPAVHITTEKSSPVWGLELTCIMLYMHLESTRKIASKPLFCIISHLLAQATKRSWQANTHTSKSMRNAPCASITMISSVCPHALQTDTSSQESVEPYLFLSSWVIMINCGRSPDAHLSVKVLTTALTAPAHPVSFPEVSWPSLMELQRHVDACGPRLSDMTALVTKGPCSAVPLCSSSHRLNTAQMHHGHVSGSALHK